MTSRRRGRGVAAENQLTHPPLNPPAATGRATERNTENALNQSVSRVSLLFFSSLFFFFFVSLSASASIDPPPGSGRGRVDESNVETNAHRHRSKQLWDFHIDASYRVLPSFAAILARFSAPTAAPSGRIWFNQEPVCVHQPSDWFLYRNRFYIIIER